MLALKTSEQGFPKAALRKIPVISEAALLKDVMRHLPSTVKTPSEMLSRMIAVASDFPRGGVFPLDLVRATCLCYPR
jgi:hypothetical protein